MSCGSPCWIFLLSDPCGTMLSRTFRDLSGIVLSWASMLPCREIVTNRYARNNRPHTVKQQNTFSRMYPGRMDVEWPASLLSCTIRSDFVRIPCQRWPFSCAAVSEMAILLCRIASHCAHLLLSSLTSSNLRSSLGGSHTQG